MGVQNFLEQARGLFLPFSLLRLTTSPFSPSTPILSYLARKLIHSRSFPFMCSFSPISSVQDSQDSLHDLHFPGCNFDFYLDSYPDLRLYLLCFISHLLLPNLT